MKKFFSFLLWLILSAAILFSGYKLETKINEYRTALNKSSSISNEVRKGRTVDFEKLKERNDDVKGWIWLKDSQIDYPIVQAEDNDFYLHRDIDKNYLFDGSLFIDCAVDHPFEDFNTVIYGHHMFSGAMFCGLEKFADKEYFDEHPVFIIETETGSYDMHVIAYCNEPDDSDLYSTHFSDGYMPSDFAPDESVSDDMVEERPSYFTKSDFINLVRTKAINISNEEFDENDKLVTLSTCAYNYESARHQVIGVLRPAKIEQKEVITESEKPFWNKWLFAQIGIGLIMSITIISPLVRIFKK